jgi:hypothetical protein
MGLGLGPSIGTSERRAIIDKRGELALRGALHRQYSTIAYRAQQGAGGRFLYASGNDARRPASSVSNGAFRNERRLVIESSR